MHLTLAHIGPKPPRPGPNAPVESLVRLYLDRITPWHPIESLALPTESDLLTRLTTRSSRLPTLPVLLDSRGKALTSSQFAHWLGARRDQGAQHILFAIGPHSGWSQPTLDTLHSQSQSLLLSFGPITLPHELARLILAEQLYRACTILANHPYHSGH